MANRHDVQHKASGGGVPSQYNGLKRGKTPVGAGNRDVAKESAGKSKPGAITKEVGGPVGKKAGDRLDKRARGGGVSKSPFSSAHQKGG